MPPSFVGIDPVTTRRYFPLLAAIALCFPLHGLARRGHERVVVVERDDVEDEVPDGRVGASEHALDAARAFLQLKPDDTRPLENLERPGHASCCHASKAKHYRHLAAKFQKIAP